jgi:lysophospholipase L1-like esterase
MWGRAGMVYAHSHRYQTKNECRGARMIPNRRLWHVAAALAVVLAALFPTQAEAVAYPRSIASTGDSITRAFNTGWLPFTDNPAASWSTGSESEVQSHYLRLRAVNPEIAGHNYNDAASGARMRDLASQMAKAAGQHAQYVTVLMGANDVCTDSENGMTSLADFRSQFSAAMDTIASRDPRARILVVSIPDIYRLWQLYKDDFLARVAWATFDICQSMLADPTSTDQADVDRRLRVQQRNIAFNAILADVCGQYARCKFDGNAAFNTGFSRADVSKRDYFHPSKAGEAKLAAVTWQAGFWASN